MIELQKWNRNATLKVNSFSIRALSSGEISLLYILSTVYPIFTSILTLSVCLQFFQVLLLPTNHPQLRGIQMFFFQMIGHGFK